MAHPKVSTFFLTFSLVVSLAANAFLLYIKKVDQLYTITEVKDGDTVTVDNNQIIRLVGIDAPELSYCGGQESKSFLDNLINGKKVTLTKVGLDKFARTLALVSLYDLNVNQSMLAAGWAVYESYSGPQHDDMKKAADQARSENKGLFPQCRFPKPDQPGCTIKGNINRNVKSYFLPSCSNYEQTMVYKDRGESWFCTEIEAQKSGFQKSETCLNRF